MNKLTVRWLIALVLLIGVPAASSAHSRFHTHFGFYFGYPSYYWGPSYYSPYYYNPYYYRPYYYYVPNPVYVEPPQPKVYVQQPSNNYWYYCPAAGKYYPYVQSCPQGWLQVVPQTSPPQ